MPRIPLRSAKFTRYIFFLSFGFPRKELEVWAKNNVKGSWRLGKYRAFPRHRETISTEGRTAIAFSSASAAAAFRRDWSCYVATRISRKNSHRGGRLKFPKFLEHEAIVVENWEIQKWLLDHINGSWVIDWLRPHHLTDRRIIARFESEVDAMYFKLRFL